MFYQFTFALFIALGIGVVGAGPLSSSAVAKSIKREQTKLRHLEKKDHKIQKHEARLKNRIKGQKEGRKFKGGGKRGGKRGRR